MNSDSENEIWHLDNGFIQNWMDKRTIFMIIQQWPHQTQKKRTTYRNAYLYINTNFNTKYKKVWHVLRETLIKLMYTNPFNEFQILSIYSSKNIWRLWISIFKYDKKYLVVLWLINWNTEDLNNNGISIFI